MSSERHCNSISEYETNLKIDNFLSDIFKFMKSELKLKFLNEFFVKKKVLGDRWEGIFLEFG